MVVKENLATGQTQNNFFCLCVIFFILRVTFTHRLIWWFVGCLFALFTQTLPRKYSMVLLNPSSNGTFGSHFNFVFARVMSGRRCFGSSWGSGLKTTLLREPVALIISR